MGNGSEGEVVINCKPLASLAFFWSQDIAVNNISLFGCGALQNSTNTNNGIHLAAFMQIKVALVLFLNGCNTINITQIHVIESPGTGVVVYNSLGVVNIDESQFLCNGGFSSGDKVMYGGGGLVIEVNEVISQSVCTITNAIFTQNTASSGKFSYTTFHSYFGLGRGGGISVVFRGDAATNNIVQINKVILDNNTAQFGGGLFLGFYDSASSNDVIITNGQAIQNMALVEKDTLLTATEGGGVFIGLIANGPGCVLNNHKQ